MKIWEKEWRLASVSRLGERTSYLRRNCYFLLQGRSAFCLGDELAGTARRLLGGNTVPLGSVSVFSQNPVLLVS